MTTVTGTYSLCGSTWVLAFTCNGPQCGVFTDYPDVTCATAAGVTTCASTTTCTGPVNLLSTFTYNQPSAAVTTEDIINLPAICQEIDVTSDSSRAGTSVTGSDIAACVPNFSQPASCFPPSSSSTLASTSTTASHSSSRPTSSAGPWDDDDWCDEDSDDDEPTARPSGPVTTRGGHGPGSGTRPGAPRTETSTILSTRTYTVTSCKPTVTNCPLGKVTSEVVTAYTTYCPDEGVQVGAKPDAPKTQGAGPHHQGGNAPSGPGAGGPAPGGHGSGGSEPVGHGAGGAAPAGHGAGGAAPAGPGAGGQAPEAWGTAPAPNHAPVHVLPVNPHEPSPATTPQAVASNRPLSPPAPVYTAGAYRARPPTVSLLWCGLLLVFGFLANGVAAMGPSHSETTLHERQVVGNAVAMADKLVTHFNTAVPGGTSQLAESLVRRLLDIGCDLGIEDECGTTTAELASTKAFSVNFMNSCRLAITDFAILTAPEIVSTPGGALLLNVDAGLLCNFLLGSFLHVPALVDGVCAYPKPCTEDFVTDPNNCGACGNVCGSGICQGSTCVTDSCTGQTCDTFTACGPGGSCVCTSTFEGTGVCGDGQTPCSGLADCTTSTDCATGFVCAINTCCDRNVCIAATDVCAAPGPPLLLFMRGYQNATIGKKGTWVDA